MQSLVRIKQIMPSSPTKFIKKLNKTTQKTYKQEVRMGEFYRRLTNAE